MKQPHVHVGFSHSGRFFDIPLYEDDIVIMPRRINSGIDFKANRDARKRLSANAYLLYMRCDGKLISSAPSTAQAVYLPLVCKLRMYLLMTGSRICSTSWIPASF